MPHDKSIIFLVYIYTNYNIKVYIFDYLIYYIYKITIRVTWLFKVIMKLKIKKIDIFKNSFRRNLITIKKKQL